MNLLWLVLLLPQLAQSKNVFVSSPFDNFRIECPKRAGATELSIRMVESVGAKRQDIVFDLTCDKVEELYPWVNIPVGISDIEREDCYYSAMFDPILNSKTEFSCKAREYVAGITRLTDTRIQIMCCRLRSREEYNCQETAFNKPIGLSRSTIIQRDNRLINGLRIEDRGYVVRFCDLSPRNIADIYNDVKETTTRAPVHTTVKPKTKVHKVSKTTWTTPRTTPSTTRMVRSTTTAKPKTVPTTQRTRRPDHTHRPPRPTSVRTRTSVKPTTTVRVPPSIVTTTSKSTTSPKIDREFSQTPAESNPSTTTKKPLQPSSSVSSQTHDNTRFIQNSVEEVDMPVIEKEKTRKSTTTQSQNTAKPKTTEEMKEIIQKIESAPSESTASQLFKETVNSLLGNDSIQNEEKPIVRPPVGENRGRNQIVNESSKFAHQDSHRQSHTQIQTTTEADVGKSIEDITMDLSRVTFNNDAFPKPHQSKPAVPGKLKFSKNNLPLRPGVSSEDGFVFLQTINSDGRRRAPMRPYRPHISLWSEEDDEMSEMFGSMEMASQNSESSNERKSRKKVTRAHRLPPPEENSSHKFSNASDEQTNEIVEMPKREQLFVKDRSLEDEKTFVLASTRKDLPVSRKQGKFASIIEQTDNAGFVDEELESSPFDDKQTTINSKQPSLSLYDKDRFEFQEDENIEDVVNKLIARTAEIRRSPVKNTQPEETWPEKNGYFREKKLADVKTKDGVKTYIPSDSAIEMHEADSMDLTEGENNSVKDQLKASKRKQTKNADSLVPMESSIFFAPTTTPEELTLEKADQSEATAPTFSTRKTKPVTTTTSYDPNVFYHTPKPKPAKKEKILTFCTKDLAIRDERNMVVACGGELDVWTPNRCPTGSDCFLSHDSTYRICCPVSNG